MKKFIEYLTEDKSRFIKKNKNLTDAEKKEVIKWFKGHVHAEAKFLRDNGNNPKVFTTMTYINFLEIKKESENTKSAKKRKMQKLRHQGIKGLKEGEDYVRVPLKTKSFLAYVPLHSKAAQVIGSSNIGDCHGQWCIANSQAATYYRTEAKRPGKVPIMVIGNNTKYTVMMNKDNRSWELWYATNNASEMTTKEGIENFSIKKELTGSKQSALYDEIRHDIWVRKRKSDGVHIVELDEYEDAITDYEHLISDSENFIAQWQEAEEYGRDYIINIITDTIEKYKERAEEAMDDFKTDFEDAVSGGRASQYRVAQNVKQRIKSIRKAVAVNPGGTDVNNDGEPVWYIQGMEKPIKKGGRTLAGLEAGSVSTDPDGVAYTRDELERMLAFAEKEYVNMPDNKNDIDQEYWDERREDAEAEAAEAMETANNLQQLIDDGDYYQVYSENRYGNDWLDDVDWSEDPPEYEHEWTEDVYEPNILGGRYDAYMTFHENYSENDGSDEYAYYEALREEAYGSSGNNFNGQEFLESLDYEHPDDMPIEVEE